MSKKKIIKIVVDTDLTNAQIERHLDVALRIKTPNKDARGPSEERVDVQLPCRNIQVLDVDNGTSKALAVLERAKRELQGEIDFDEDEGTMKPSRDHGQSGAGEQEESEA